MADTPEVLWRPDPNHLPDTRVEQFKRWLSEHRGLAVSRYEDLWRWSVDELDEFWAAFGEFIGVRWRAEPRAVREGDEMPGVRWFPGGELNYAEHALSGVAGAEKRDDELAVVFHREDGLTEQLTFGELRAKVGAATGWWRWRRTARKRW